MLPWSKEYGPVEFEIVGVGIGPSINEQNDPRGSGSPLFGGPAIGKGTQHRSNEGSKEGFLRLGNVYDGGGENPKEFGWDFPHPKLHQKPNRQKQAGE